MKFTKSDIIKALSYMQYDISDMGYTIDDIKKGANIELEHGTINWQTNVTNDDLIITVKIALAHLNEDPKYYKKLAKIEGSGINEYIMQKFIVDLNTQNNAKISKEQIKKTLETPFWKKFLKTLGISIGFFIFLILTVILGIPISFILFILFEKPSGSPYWKHYEQMTKLYYNTYGEYPDTSSPEFEDFAKDYLMNLGFAQPEAEIFDEDRLITILIKKLKSYIGGSTLGSSTPIQQSLIFHQSYPLSYIEKFIKKHNFNPIKQPHQVGEYIRFRLAKPNKNAQYFTIKLKKGIYLIMMK